MKKNGQTLKEALHFFLVKHNLQKGFIATKAKFLWGTLMGELVERYTEKVYVQHQVLHIKLKASELRQDLFYRKKEIIDKINKDLGQNFIKDIVFYQVTLLMVFYSVCVG